MNAPKPLHQTADWKSRQGGVDPFPKPGTKWRPLHRTPHGNNKPISIRRFIAEKKK